MDNIVFKPETDFQSQLSTLQDVLSAELEETAEFAEHLKTLTIIDSDGNKHTKAAKTEAKNKAKAVVSSMKKFKEDLVTNLLGDVTELSDKLVEVNKEVETLAGNASNTYETQVIKNNLLTMSNYLTSVGSGYGFKITVGDIDILLSKLPSDYNNYSTPMSKSEGYIDALLTQINEECRDFEITFDEYREFKFSIQRYTAHLKSIEAALKKAESPDSMPTAKSFSARVTLNEKLETKKSARKTYKTVFDDMFKNLVAEMDELDLTSAERIELMKRLEL